MTENLIVKKRRRKKTAVKTTRGNLPKKSLTFLRVMQEEFSFEPAREFMLTYVDEKELYTYYYDKFRNPKKRATMTPEQIVTFWKLHADLKDSQKTILKYCYPTLRSKDIKLEGGVQPIFNINLAPKQNVKLKSANPEKASEQVVDVIVEEE